MGVALALVVAAVALVQARQFALLKQTVAYQDDYVVLSLYQVEAEYLRLREQLGRAPCTKAKPWTATHCSCATTSGSAASACCTTSAPPG